MSKSERKAAGIDLSNVSVLICGLAAKYWLIYFIFVEVVLGVSGLAYFISRIGEENALETSTGIMNLLCVALLLCSLYCQSKTFFTIIALILGFDASIECYLLFTRILLSFEVSSPYYSDYLILVVFSVIRAVFSVTFTIVLVRLSWCNGLSDEEDLEKMAIYECIEEMGFLKCQKCSELFENEETPTVTKID